MPALTPPRLDIPSSSSSKGHLVTKTRAEIETELARLRGKKKAATGWSAAIGARDESIRRLEARLRGLDAPAAAPANARLSEVERWVLATALLWARAHEQGSSELAALTAQLLEAAQALAEQSRKNSQTAARGHVNPLEQIGIYPRG